MFETNKAIFGNKSIDSIPLPTNRVRVKGNKREIHFFTIEEINNFFATGNLTVLDETAWTEIPNNEASTKAEKGAENDNTNTEP